MIDYLEKDECVRYDVECLPYLLLKANEILNQN
jgi:hypothetical protein